MRNLVWSVLAVGLTSSAVFAQTPAAGSRARAAAGHAGCRVRPRHGGRGRRAARVRPGRVGQAGFRDAGLLPQDRDLRVRRYLLHLQLQPAVGAMRHGRRGVDLQLPVQLQCRAQLDEPQPRRGRAREEAGGGQPRRIPGRSRLRADRHPGPRRGAGRHDHLSEHPAGLRQRPGRQGAAARFRQVRDLERPGADRVEGQLELLAGPAVLVGDSLLPHRPARRIRGQRQGLADRLPGQRLEQCRGQQHR